MKRPLLLLFAAMLMAVLGLVLAESQEAQIAGGSGSLQTRIPDIIILGKDSKVGKVTFNHVKHNGGDYGLEAGITIDCISCHHVAQPASEAAKYPPLRTAWPADRTTTLTADLFLKDPKQAGVAACRDCHARAGEVPKLMPEMPVVKQSGSTMLVKMTNQMAFHRACDVCHFEVRSKRQFTKAPSPTTCTSCHKREG